MHPQLVTEYPLSTRSGFSGSRWIPIPQPRKRRDARNPHVSPQGRGLCRIVFVKDSCCTKLWTVNHTFCFCHRAKVACVVRVISKKLSQKEVRKLWFVCGVGSEEWSLGHTLFSMLTNNDRTIAKEVEI
jgi:hypothetical protein